MKRLLLIVTLILLSAGWINGQTKLTENTLRLEKGTVVKKATPEIMNWLEGSWTGKGLGGDVKESWQRTGTGEMMGMFVMSRAGKANFYEFLLLTVENENLVVKLKHFTPKMVSWEEKEKSVKFRFIKKEKNRYYFNGLTFEKSGDGKLKIFVALKQRDGTTQEAPFVFSRDQ